MTNLAQEQQLIVKRKREGRYGHPFRSVFPPLDSLLESYGPISESEKTVTKMRYAHSR